MPCIHYEAKQASLFSFLGFLVVSKAHEKAKQVDTAKTNRCVNYSGKPRHITKYKGYKVKSEQAYKCPVQCADNNNGKGSTI